MTMISSIRTFVGKPGHRSSVALRNISIPKPPSWMELSRMSDIFRPNKTYNPLQNIFTNSDVLLAHGRISWGYLVMANTLMFELGDDDHPGVFVYSHDPFVDRYPRWLSRPASHISYYHNEETPAPNPPSCYQHYISIRDEVHYQTNQQLPLVMTDNRVVHYASIIIFRQHLPHGHLTGKLVPMLTLDTENHPKMAMILPCQLWPDDLLADWEQES